MWRDLEAFRGAWQITRVIEDARAQETMRFVGEVRTAFDGGFDGILRWQESGHLHSAAGVFEGRRTYLWRAADGGIEVLFEDGRPFHQIACAAQSKAHHDCPPDSYDLAYDFGDWPRWRVVHQVSGPRKNYTMKSIYEPKLM